jgi:pyridoxine kinase
MNVLSIQSAVTYGHVGNSAAVFILQRLGHEAWPIDTVRFSNHPGHGGFRGRVTPAGDLAELVAGLDERGFLKKAAALLSGYLGAAEQGPVVADAAARLRAANNEALWVLDPVIGDRGRVFVREGVPDFIRDVAMPNADILTPNAFELEYLSGRKPATLQSARDAAKALVARGRDQARRVVVATGLTLDDAPAKTLTTLAVTASRAWRVVTPAIDHPGYGMGDSFAAAFTALYLTSRKPEVALEGAVSAVHGILAKTAQAGAVELALVDAQAELMAPSRRFAAEPLS